MSNGQLRIRLYRRVGTPLGVAEVTMLDVPLRPSQWNRQDERAFDRLDALVATAESGRAADTEGRQG